MDWTPLGALVVSIILLPVVGALWYNKADKDAIDNLKQDDEHIRQWLATHAANDDRMFREIRQAQHDLSQQIQHNFEAIVMTIRKNGNGSAQ